MALGDSLDFDNSDDLNKIIQKYETLLGSAGKDKQNKHAKMEESWGSGEKLSEEIISSSSRFPLQ